MFASELVSLFVFRCTFLETHFDHTLYNVLASRGPGSQTGFLYSTDLAGLGGTSAAQAVLGMVDRMDL